MNTAMSVNGGRQISANSINLSSLVNTPKKLENLTISEYEVSEPVQRIVNPYGHYKGFCKLPAWGIFLIANAILIICIACVAIVLGLALTKSSSNSKCTSNSDCDTTLGLICSGGTCACSNTMYADAVTGICTAKKTLNTTCSTSSQCDNSVLLTCSNTTIQFCTCDSNRFWNGSYCVLISSNNGGCIPSSTITGCDSTLGLVCSNTTKTCGCTNTTQFWSGSICMNYKSYLQSCLTVSWCAVNTNLLCQTQGANAGLCDCPTKYYWDGTKCLAVKTYNIACGSTSECDTSLNLYCAVSGTMSGKCACNDNSYWTTSCLSKLTYSQTCSSNSSCDNTVLLYCKINKCDCDSVHYWDATSLVCLPAKAVAGGCSSNTTCDSTANLICSNSGASVGSCSCPSTMFWNNTGCQTKLGWKTSCTNSQQCNDFLGLVCSSTSAFLTTAQLALNASICDCSSYTLYYDGSTCRSKKSNLVACSTSYECQDYNGLICNQTKCNCYLTHFWNTSACQQKKVYTVPCVATTECDDFRYLYCPNVLNSCNCPFTSTGYYCDCQPTSYWDAIDGLCVARGTYGDACPLGNYQCSTATTGLSCISSVCDCPSKALNWYWNGNMCKKCPTGWTIFNYNAASSNAQYCYNVASFKANWNTAEQYCKTFGGILLTLNSATENTIFQSIGSALIPTGSAYYVGLNGQTTLNVWTWQTTSTLGSIWCSGGYPDTTGTYRCGALYATSKTSFCMRSANCTAPANFICES